eukprot:TRINITY_DN1577_c0_g1_i1.p1 TRINITY_DN1577_c0_g1~~TRINITY_DN1577_c0_g1_i1.p1  ORF type:complete len:285 (+),score=43.04 TRINITY_DN1577_c0_g1_i1:50-904(+)
MSTTGFLLAAVVICLLYCEVNGLASQAQMDITCKMSEKKANNPQVNWNAPEVVNGLAHLYNQFKNLTGQDYVYCDVLGNFVILIGAAFTQRQCGNGDSFCRGVSGQVSSGTPNCTAFYCGKNNGTLCRSFWGAARCVALKKCTFNCIRFFFNFSSFGWDMFPKNFSSVIWAIQGDIFWHKRDYLNALESSKRFTNERSLTLSHPEVTQTKRRENLKSLIRLFLEKRVHRTSLVRQASSLSCGECGCTNYTPSCNDCLSGRLPLGSPCVDTDFSYKPCCICYVVS